MKTKKSKIVAILILAIMVLNINVPGAYAHENDTTPNECIKHEPKPKLIIEMFGISAGSSGHYVERPCSECSYSSLESWACPGNPSINYPDRIILED
jgi:hypothetical protein